MDYIEKCLWEYQENKFAVKALKDEISDLTSANTQDYQYHGEKTGWVSDPVERTFSRKNVLEKKIKHLERVIKSVEGFIDSLIYDDIRTQQFREILKLRYFKHMSINDVADKLAISTSTFNRRCKEIIKLARKFILE